MTELDKQWNMPHEQLVKFKRSNGLCMVPRGCQQEKSLGKWVSTQQAFHDNNRMRLDRKERLDKIAFAWKVACDFKPGKIWFQHCGEFIELEQKNGHCLVPRSNCEAGRWVNMQQNLNTNDAMLQCRKDLLDELGFVRNCDELHESKWNEQHEKLVEFVKKTGHCPVPSRRNKEDAFLHAWLVTQ
jgi:hypothetical protein